MDNQQLQEFVEKYGSPLFVYDGQRLKENVDQLRSCFTTDALDVHYACKALTNRSILALL
jgi:diaminopimelate decarboxylase